MGERGHVHRSPFFKVNTYPMSKKTIIITGSEKQIYRIVKENKIRVKRDLIEIEGDIDLESPAVRQAKLAEKAAEKAQEEAEKATKAKKKLDAKAIKDAEAEQEKIEKNQAKVKKAEEAAQKDADKKKA